MSASRRVGLTCDGFTGPCGNAFGDEVHATAKEARAAARRSGWSTKGSRDYCDACTHQRGVRLRLDRSLRMSALARGIRMPSSAPPPGQAPKRRPWPSKPFADWVKERHAP